MSENIFIGVFTEDLFKGKLGVAKALIVVCGQERVKVRDQKASTFDLVASQTNVNVAKKMSDLFDVDISGTQ